MSTLDVTALSSGLQAAAETESLTLAGQTAPLWRLPHGIERDVTWLQGPSSLTLALIGAATLLAYRSIHQRLAAAAPAVVPMRRISKPTQQRTGKKRRRAA